MSTSTSSSSKPTVLILGAGANVGLSVARHFKQDGWAVAGAGRTKKADVDAAVDLFVQADFADPATLAGVFAETQQKLGVPSCVVYNAYAFTPAHVSNPLELPLSVVQQDLAVNTVSAYESARLSVQAWQARAPVLAQGQASPLFIFTGNMMNTQLYPLSHSLGMGKNATAYFLETAAVAYHGRFRFYFADERTPEGESTMADIDGDAHGVEYLKLVNGVAEEHARNSESAGQAQGQAQGPWDWTFVKGQGYLKVSGQVDREARMVAFPGWE